MWKSSKKQLIKSMIICQKCVLNDRIPGTRIGEEGICNSCLNLEKKWNQREGKEKFEKKLESIAKRNLGIDAMAPLEGFQNKIIREKEVIGRMLQRIRMKKKIIETADLSEELDGRLRNQQTSMSLLYYLQLYMVVPLFELVTLDQSYQGCV